MKRLRLFGVALVVLFGVGALSASGAFALPELLPIPTGGGGVTDASDGTTKLQFQTAEHLLECQHAEGTGWQETDTLGTFHVVFTGCETAILGKCTSSGDSAGSILTLGSFHYVLDTLGSSEESVAVLFLLAPTKYECTSFGKNELIGNLVCLILKPLFESKVHLFHCNHAAKVQEQEDKGYYNDAGTFVPTQLLSSLNGGSFVESSLLLLEQFSFKEAVAFMTD
jgi:hypothetical protein